MISVVIPLFNKEATIRRAIQSVLANGDLLDEVIVVDDVSTDGGPQIVEQLDDHRVRLVRRPKNGGAAAARNTGVALSQSKYIAFLDADDIWCENHLELMTELIDLYPKCRVFGSQPALMYQENNCCSGDEVIGRSWMIHSYIDAMAEGRSVVSSSSIVVEKMLLEDIGGFDTSLPVGEDMDCWIRLSDASPFAVTGTITACYAQNVPGSLCLNSNPALSYKIVETLIGRMHMAQVAGREDEAIKLCRATRTALLDIALRMTKRLMIGPACVAWFRYLRYRIRCLTLGRDPDASSER